jgi:hypothetical protein
MFWNVLTHIQKGYGAMKQPTDSSGRPCCPMGWLGATVTAVALLAVLVSAILLLNGPVFAAAPGQGDDLAAGSFSIVEPPLRATGPALPVQTADRVQHGEVTPEVLLANWNYTGGPPHRPKPSPGH